MFVLPGGAEPARSKAALSFIEGRTRRGYDEVQDRTLSQAETMNVDGIDVLVEGAGPEAIVMVHGWPDTHRLWDRQVEALRGSYRCVRFTLPGFDRRQPRRAYSLDEVVEAIHRVVEQACPGEQVSLLLHDWGCVFGYQFAMRHPQLVKRVIGVDIGDAGSRRHVQTLGAKAKAMIFGYQVWLALAWRIGGRVGDSMARAMARALGCPSNPEYIGSHMGYPYYLQWTGALGGLRQAKVFTPSCPMLFIYGKRKSFMFHSPAWAEGIASRPGSQVVGFDTGHWVMVEKPKEFNSALTAWMSAGNAMRR
jgi:pimeloyl-ACP methyl ester carboxylesterase